MIETNNTNAKDIAIEDRELKFRNGWWTHQLYTCSERDENCHIVEKVSKAKLNSGGQKKKKKTQKAWGEKVLLEV